MGTKNRVVLIFLFWIVVDIGIVEIPCSCAFTAIKVFVSSETRKTIYDTLHLPIHFLRASSIEPDGESDERNLDSLLTRLDDAFDYEGRMAGSPHKQYRCGFVVVLGAANMGKSTLMNALLQEDLCISTARPQTTRHAILGILSSSQCQVCLVDTPGVIADPAYKLQEGMMEAVMGAFNDADVLLVVTDVFSTPIPNDQLFARVQYSSKPVIVAINKIDLANSTEAGNTSPVKQDKTLTVEDAVARWRTWIPNALCILPISARNGVQDVGVQALRTILMGGPDVPGAIRNLGRPIPGMFRTGTQFFLTDEQAAQLLPLSPPLYDQELLTDRTDRFIASELIRSSLFETLQKELPYCCEVQIQQFKEPTPENKIIRISADILVERESQKLIVIGKNGEQVKNIGIRARKKLQEFFQTQVYLQLNVKVDKDWRNKESRLQEYGYLKKKKSK